MEPSEETQEIIDHPERALRRENKARLRYGVASIAALVIALMFGIADAIGRPLVHDTIRGQATTAATVSFLLWGLRENRRATRQLHATLVCQAKARDEAVDSIRGEIEKVRAVTVMGMHVVQRDVANIAAELRDGTAQRVNGRGLDPDTLHAARRVQQRIGQLDE